jgi:hypothetical protein
MVRKNQHSFSKRQREQKKAEKSAQKRDRRAAPGDSPAPLPETTHEPTAPVDDDAEKASS